MWLSDDNTNIGHEKSGVAVGLRRHQTFCCAIGGCGLDVAWADVVEGGLEVFLQI